MTDSLSQYCPNCEAQANTIEELRAANERWVVAFNLTEADATGRIEALRERVKVLEDACQEYLDAFETAINGELGPNSQPISTRSTTYVAGEKERIEALTAENEALKKSGRALLNAKHKEAAEAKLWFEKGQALTVENELLRKALEEAPIIALGESGAEFKSRQGYWLEAKAFPALGEQP